MAKKPGQPRKTPQQNLDEWNLCSGLLAGFAVLLLAGWAVVAVLPFILHAIVVAVVLALL